MAFGQAFPGGGYADPRSPLLQQLATNRTTTAPGGLPVIPSPVRLNPDGSAAPVAGTMGTGAAGPIGVPPNPTTGAAAARGVSGIGALNTVQDNPTAIINDIFGATGQDPYAGLADALAGAMTPDQIGTLVGILSANAGQIPDPGSQYNLISSLYEGLMGSQQLPSLAQLFGGVFNSPNAGNPNNPFYGMLTGGDPGAQVGQLLGAVMDMSQATGVNDLQARSIAARLNAIARQYLSSSNKIGANQTFVDYLQRQAPGLVGALGG